MLFNTLSYAKFLPIVFILYWFFTGKSIKRQNILLLLASYYFYACWDFRFLFLLMFSTFLDYFTGLRMADTQNTNSRKFWFWLSVVINLGFLGIFKYYNFFINSFADAIGLAGIKTSFWTLKVILPVGISFYTFHGLSYVIDIYKKRIEPEKKFVDYAVFVSFFPLLVAGPIERATHLLPQIKQKRTFDYSNAVNGLRQILWGLFKKIVIADNCAGFANTIFNQHNSYNSITLIAGAIFFAFQIYADFSGYSDIAIGTARLFGIELLRNFAFPYFSRDIAEFWRRWHISLSTWFRDYVYVPLGGSKGGNAMRIRNTFIIFIISGFWHGANWTFIAWGFLNALYIMPSILLKSNRKYLDTVAKGKLFPTTHELFSMMLTFGLAVFAWIFFRSENMTQALQYISEIFTKPLIAFPQIPLTTLSISTVLLALFFIIIEWLGREQQYALAALGLKWPAALRYVFYYCLVLCIVLFGGNVQQFIYFQF